VNKQAIVYIIDDDARMRESFRSLLESASLVTEEYESAEAFLAGADQRLPACLLLDLTMPHTWSGCRSTRSKSIVAS
jgi:FixJ family two-component response regulator